jgi:hypothetical protein
MTPTTDPAVPVTTAVRSTASMICLRLAPMQRTRPMVRF